MSKTYLISPTSSSSPPSEPFDLVPFSNSVLYSRPALSTGGNISYIGGGSSVSLLIDGAIGVSKFFSSDYRSGNDGLCEIIFQLQLSASEALSSFEITVNSTGGGGAGISFPVGFSVSKGIEIYQGMLSLGGSLGGVNQFIGGYCWDRFGGNAIQFSSSAISLYSGVVTMDLKIKPGAVSGSAHVYGCVIEAKSVI
jgi:hypothetical protein